MKLFNPRKRWKYFAKSSAIISSEKSLYRVFTDSPHPIPLQPETKQTHIHIKTEKMKGGRA